MNMSTDALPHLEGTTIKSIYRNVRPVAELHSVLTSPRGQYLHRRLLHALRGSLAYDEIERLRKEYGVEESDRHINRLARWQLIEPTTTLEGDSGYVRTDLGEEAINAVRELERKIGEQSVSVISEAAMGENCIKLFLTIFGDNKKPELSTREVAYGPREFGKLIRGFARSIEGVSSMDKLDEVGIVSYMDDGNIHVNARRSTAFYAYLRKLYQILVRSDCLDRPPGSSGANG